MQRTERRWFRFANVAKDTAEVWIYDLIGLDLWTGEGVSAKDFAQELHDVTAPEILVHLNSPGGDVFEGVAIASALREHDARVTVKVEGLAASAASFIAMAGDHVIMSQGSMIMIHEVSGVTMGTAADHRKTAGLLDKLGDDVAGFYVRRAGGSVAEWRTRMAEETWYDAEEAVAVGFADEVSSEQAPKNHFNLARFRKVPERLRNAGTDEEPAASSQRDATLSEDEQDPQGVRLVAVQEPTGATTQDRAGDPLLARLRIALAEASIA